MAAPLAWKLVRSPSGPWDFYVQEMHDVFRSATMTRLDALLAELSWVTMDFLRGNPVSGISFASVLCDLRAKYGGPLKIEPKHLASEARLAIAAIARSLENSAIDERDGQSLFEELSPTEQDAVIHKMAARGKGNPQVAIRRKQFLEYASNRAVEEFFVRHPELFLDGRYWDAPYSSLDYGRAAVNEEARHQTVQFYRSLIADAAWLCEQDANDLAHLGRSRLLRAALSLEMLSPDIEAEPGG
ncbi:MAG TPA: hypothetical protein VGQ40_05005 [Chthoniobacterales bacterium]|nr:hypothetical protein [Chthoniobacterales bacterium]